MKKKKDVKKNLLDHSQAKVRLLDEYLKRYLNIISNDGYTQRIKLYDLFCSEGQYQDGGEGSPIVILRNVKEVHYANVAKAVNIPKMDCHFNDSKSDKVENVKRVVAEKSLYYKEFGDIEYTTNDYQIELDKLYKVLPTLRKQKAFVFIDPYEYKHIKASQIKNLMAGGNTEVLLWLPTQQMYRFSNNGTPEALHDFIGELVPYKEWKATDSVWHFVYQLRDGFQAYMGKACYVDAFTIQKDESTVFCLFFFTPNIKGFEKMLESKWKIDSTYGEGWEYSHQQTNLFTEQKTNPLEEKLEHFLSNGVVKTNAELYEFVLDQRYLPTHLIEILKNWQQQGRIQITNADGTHVRKGTFYISYQYYKPEAQKLFYKLK